MYQKIVLVGERPKSLNRLLRLHWSKYDAEVKRVSWVVLAALAGVREPLEETVDICVTAYMKGKVLDSDNVPDKLYIDGLRHAGLLLDDTHQFVRYATTRAEKDNRRPRVEIEIRGIE